MLTFVIFATSLFVVPTYLSVAIFKRYFPNHTLRISDANLIPLGVGFSIFINSWIIFLASQFITPIYCSNDFVSASGYVIDQHPWYFALAILGVTFQPVIVSWGICHFCNRCWLKYLKIKFGATDIEENKIERLISRTIEHFLNYMGKLTIYDYANSALMVDILDDNDSLYSGIYTSYHTENGRLAGIALSRVVRFTFKAEAERKREKADAEEKELPYLLPNQGEMFFPKARIRNFHFWKIKRGSAFVHDFSSSTQQVLSAWHLILSQALPDLELRVVALIGKSDDASHLGRVLQKIPIELSKLEIENKPE